MSLNSLAVWFLSAALGYVVLLQAAVVFRIRKSREGSPDFFVVKYWLWCLLRNGYDGENVLFCDMPKCRFIRFEKYTGTSGISGIKLTFPEIGWGEEFLPKLRDYAEHKGLAFRASDKNEPAYAHVMVGDDIDEAFSLWRIIWTKFFRFDEQTQYRRQIGDLSTINELLDTAAQPSDAERQERHLRYLNARLKHAGLAWLQVAGFSDLYMAFGALFLPSAIGFLAALIGLPISTLLALGEPPGWHFEFGQIRLQGSSTSLIFFSVYLLSSAITRRFLRIRLIDTRKMGRFEKTLHAPKKTIFVGIPVAVVFIWLRI